MIEQINMAEFKTNMKRLAPYLKEDTNERVKQKLEEKGLKVFSESHIQKVRAGHKYVQSIVDAIIEVAKENRAIYKRQLKQLSSFA